MKVRNIIKKIFTAILIFSFAVSGLNFQVNPAKAALTPGGAVGPVNPDTGFPNWYMDQNGLALELMEAADTFGISAAVEPGNPFSQQIGFGAEGFWWSTEADIGGPGQPLDGIMVLAMEAAFAGESAINGEQSAFGRARFTIDVPAAGTYTVTYPYGAETFVVDAVDPGAPEIKNEGSDIGCFATAGITSCDPNNPSGNPNNFSLALSSQIGPFLTWDTFNLDPALTDPALVNPAKPGKRYVGNVATPHKIKGSPTGNNFIRVDGPIGADLDPALPGVQTTWQTDLFTVTGRIAVIDTIAPTVASVSPSELIVDALGQIPANTVISANITDDLGVRAAAIDLSSLGNDFSATLNGAQEVPTTASTATGAGTFTIDTAANTLSFNINYSGLVGVGNAETAAHIHGPAAAGVNALPVFDLPLGASKIGVWNYPENLEVDILAGRMYANIHSILFSNGEIRGQILPTSNIQNMILTALPITNGTWGVIIPSITRMGTFSLPITTHDGSNTTNFNFQLSVVNPAPIANPDSARIGAGIGEQADLEVLLNDTDPNGNLPLSLVSAQNASAGTGVIAPDGQHVIITSPTTDFAGVITAEYTVADSLGATSTGNISVNVVRDIIPPVITILGANPDSVSFGAISYTDPGATALDDFDGNITANIIKSGLPINTRGASPQTITYTVTDAVGNVATATRAVNIVPDTTAPVITVNGASPMNVEINSVFTDPGATALDDVDGAVAVQAVSNVNTAVIGAYSLNYTAQDTSGNIANLSRVVNVMADATAPVITILGNNPATILKDSVYTDAGATALDNIDGNLTLSIITAGLPLNTTATGTFAVIYNVADAAGNTTIATRTVNVVTDITPPVITITGANPVSLTVGDAYTDAGATANDNIDGNITARIQAASTVNAATAGTYSVVYTVSDLSGNSATSTRTVNVSEPAPAPAPAVIGGGGGGGGGGGFLPAPSFQTTATITAPGPEVQSQIDRQLEIERGTRSQGQVLGERIEFRQEQIKELENEAGIINSKNLDSLLLNTYAARQNSKEAEARSKFTAKLKVNIKGLSQADESALTNFIAYGTANTKKLGEGERAGVLDSYKAAYGKLPTTKSDWTDVLKIANGRFPGQISAAAEAKAKIEFKKIYLRDPNLNNQNDKAAINVMAYGLRPDKRNTNSEKAAILSFKAIFKKNPVSASDWDKVRAIAYSGAKR